MELPQPLAPAVPDLTLGVDPGLDGAIAFLDGASLVHLLDYPKTPDGDIDLPALTESLKPLAPRVRRAIVELNSARPKQGVSSTFKFGRITGQVEGILAGLGIPIIHTRPNIWKRLLGLSADKLQSVKLAEKTWPQFADQFRGPRGGLKDGRAEAALLGLVGARARGVIGVVRGFQVGEVAS